MHDQNAEDVVSKSHHVRARPRLSHFRKPERLRFQPIAAIVLPEIELLCVDHFLHFHTHRVLARHFGRCQMQINQSACL
jgi:hypothetical protein